MAKTYLIRAALAWDPASDTVTFCAVDDDLNAQPISDYSTLESAIAAHDDLKWHILSDEERAADDVAGDVLAFGVH